VYLPIIEKNKMKIDIIAGARPNFMKIAPIIEAIVKARAGGKDISYRLVHTGQHYDEKMSGEFFKQLNIPMPDVNLEVGSGTQAEQTAKIMVKYEALLLESACDLCIVVGDVTSTMACSIAAKKLNIKVAHVEGGIRSWDVTMPEEINRMVTDSISDYFFTTSEVANTNLRKLGFDEKQIYFVGNTMIDTLLKQMPNFTQPGFWSEEKLEAKKYFVITLHRPSNVDDEGQLANLLREILAHTRQHRVVFPVHPRTRKVLDRINLQDERLILVEPQGYLQFNYLVQNSFAVITDSGGITEETTVMGIPCFTLRNSTERPETCSIGTNELIGTNPKDLEPYLAKLFEGSWKKGAIPPLWDGKTAERIVEVLLNNI
jgi:UDP-N-acetylglucosamine 2-epimerase (non-hydrolysing)